LETIQKLHDFILRRIEVILKANGGNILLINKYNIYFSGIHIILSTPYISRIQKSFFNPSIKISLNRCVDHIYNFFHDSSCTKIACKSQCNDKYLRVYILLYRHWKSAKKKSEKISLIGSPLCAKGKQMKSIIPRVSSLNNAESRYIAISRLKYKNQDNAETRRNFYTIA